ncbi:MAG: hypothetical protein E2O59_03605 [Gammaproteobacteria bacterium]|nr:MAG: hypothetical protein E2O59_03605 [Gammaproteobacteria bacterium]
MAKAKANLDWLSAAQEALNGDFAYRKLGSTDVTLGLSIGDQARLVTFEAFEIASIIEVSAMDLRDADIVLEMSAKDWNAYLRQRAKGKGPSLLTLDLDARVIKGRSPLDRLKLERYNLSLQAFIDKGAELAA